MEAKNRGETVKFNLSNILDFKALVATLSGQSVKEEYLEVINVGGEDATTTAIRKNLTVSPELKKYLGSQAVSFQGDSCLVYICGDNSSVVEYTHSEPIEAVSWKLMGAPLFLQHIVFDIDAIPTWALARISARESLAFLVWRTKSTGGFIVCPPAPVEDETPFLIHENGSVTVPEIQNVAGLHTVSVPAK